MDIRLTGRTAIITGGSKGIGLGIAKCYAEAGADVAIIARRRGPLDEAANAIDQVGPGRVAAISADVSRAEEVERAYAETLRQLGKVDIVVNNAGVARAGPFEQLTDAALQEDLDQKLFAAVRLTRLAWPHMKERRWGRVINILSIFAKAPPANTAPTAISRAAGMALTKILAAEGAAHGILVNALMVGLIDAEQHEEQARRLGVPYAEHVERLGRTTPIGRIGQPYELAALACLLASDAGAFISGTAINVDGGRSPVV
jgi:3-oxoacyl-[acyl-carrier protein] reductase